MGIPLGMFEEVGGGGGKFPTALYLEHCYMFNMLKIHETLAHECVYCF